MKVVIIPDSFKESLSAVQVGEAIQLGFEKVLPGHYHLLPIGDGGEGTLAALTRSMGLKAKKQEVTGPFGRKILASYSVKDEVGIIEMAEVVGLSKIPLERRQPLTINTRGIGELILDLAKSGIKKIIIGIGGSASNDGGIGMASALGYRFFDKTGQLVEPLGENLGRVSQVDASQVSPLLEQLEVIILSDVNNPLCGQNGATYVFGKQKGLTTAQLAKADAAMNQFYTIANPQVIHQKGSGAGGGMGAGLMTFVNGQLVSGIDYVLDIIEFDRIVKDADLVIVGEGRLDDQSLAGKAPVGIARRTPAEIPLIAICGSVGLDWQTAQEYGIDAAFSTIRHPAVFAELKETALQDLEATAQHIAATIRLFDKKK